MSSSTKKSASKASSASSTRRASSHTTDKYDESKRKRNNEHVRKSRERKKEESEQMNRAYAENEKRIQYLEKIEKQLTYELSKEPKKKNDKGKDSSENRPNWFGEPF